MENVTQRMSFLVHKSILADFFRQAEEDGLDTELIRVDGNYLIVRISYTDSEREAMMTLTELVSDYERPF